MAKKRKATEALGLEEQAKRAKQAWKADKDNKTLKKAWKKAKKALAAAAEAKATAAPVSIDSLRSAMKAAKKAWKQNKGDKVLKSAYKAAKKAVADAEGSCVTDAAAAEPASSGKKKAAGGARVAKTSAAEVKAWREKSTIKVSGTDSDQAQFYPFAEFADSGLPKKVLEVCKNFERPTPIQAQAWPIVLNGRDMIGVAETGSGKTLGFLLPALSHILALDAKHGAARKKGKLPCPDVLVLAPTRELACQIQDVAASACKGPGQHSVCVYGGVSKWDQIKEMKKGPRGVHILVATPGRLLGLAREGKLTLEDVKYMVLDEADRMLDMGFEPDVRAIFAQTDQKNRQTLLFSATWPVEVQKLGNEFVTNPIRVDIGDRGGDKLLANKRVTQEIEVIEPHLRDRRLLQLLKQYHSGSKINERLMVFVLYKKEASRVEEQLRRAGHRCIAIHGNKSQDQRTSALESFRSGKVPMLVCTDVAARGLDIPNVETVINYSFPLTVEDYVHRIGRTGRAGKTGVSHTFFTKNDKNLSGELINVLKQAGAPVPDSLMKFGTFTKRKKHAMYGDFGPRDDGRPMAKKVHIKFS